MVRRVPTGAGAEPDVSRPPEILMRRVALARLALASTACVRTAPTR